jgi:glycosyltransferase involved in cell wall biosynthesis
VPRARILHITVIDMSLALILGPQLRAMKDAGYEVYGASAPGPYVEEIKSWGIGFVPLNHAVRSMSPWQDVLAMGEMYRAVRRLKPDLVHTHLIKPSTYGRPAAWAARAPIVVDTVHGLYATRDSSWKRRAVVYTIERVASVFSQAELVQNPEDIDVMARIGVPRHKLHLLNNGIDMDRFDPSAVEAGRVAELRAEMGAGPGDVVVGVVGRLTWEKGYREVFAAAERLKSIAPQVKVVVVGPLEPAKSDGLTEQDVLRAEQHSGVRFLGLRHDVVELYAAFDIFALASYREGFSRSGMEAAAMGLPIVTTDVRGCRQVVEDGVTGLLVPKGDTGALADAIAALSGDPARRKAMAAASRRKALAEFDQRQVIKITLDLYDRLLSNARHRRLGDAVMDGR